MKVDVDNWVDQYGDYLYRFALSRLHDPVLAEDVVQETFLGALQNLDSYNGKVELKYWLRGILRNKTVDCIRKSLREIPTDELRAFDEAPNRLMNLAGIPQRNVQRWTFNPDEHYEDKEFWATFASCLGKLKSPLRHIFTLKEIEGLDSEKICKEYDITPNNLWVMIHRARKQLKHCLIENWGHRRD